MTAPPTYLVSMRLCRLSAEELAEELGISVTRANSILARPELDAACAAAEERIRTSLRREITDWVMDALDEIHGLAGLPPGSVDHGLAADAVAAAIEANPEARFTDPEPLEPDTVISHLHGARRRAESRNACSGQFVQANCGSDARVQELIIRLGGSSSPN